jgi:hypothetical protein
MTVKPSIAAALLAYAASTDNRQPSEEAAHGWANALDERVTLPDGKAAIDAHRATSTDWLLPAHVNAEVRRIRKARADAMGVVNPPAELADRPALENTWKREYARAICDGEEPDAAEKRACDALGIDIPLQLEPIPRPEAVKRLMATHGTSCKCGCLTKPVRPEEGAA